MCNLHQPHLNKYKVKLYFMSTLKYEGITSKDVYFSFSKYFIRCRLRLRMIYWKNMLIGKTQKKLYHLYIDNLS